MKLRLWLLLLSISIVSLLLVGCKGTEKASEQGGDGEKQKLSILTTWEISDVRPSKDETKVGQWLEKELNMDMELVTIPGEAISTKINSLAASGNLPTLLLKTSDSNSITEINKLGEKGVFLNITDYLDKVPNYAKYLEDNYVRSEISDSNGNIYGFTKVYTDGNIMYTTPIIRQDLLEGSEYSNTSIKTIEDLTGALEYLTEKTGYPAWVQRNGYDSFMEKSGLLWNLSNKTFYDYEQDKFTHLILESRAKDYIQWLKDLRTKNVIHPDWAIMTDETWEGILASNNGFFTIDRMSIIGDGNFSKEFNWLPVDYPQIQGKAFLQPNQAKTISTTSWVINAKADQKEIDKALEFMNFLYDENNHKTLTLGFEDETYTTEDPNTLAGIRWLIQIYGENANNPNAELLFTHGIQSFTRLQTPIDMQSFPGTYPEVMYAQIDHINNDLGGFRPATPTVSFTTEVQEKLATMENALNTYVDQNLIQFIEGKRSMDEWNKFVDEVESKGLLDIVEEYNTAYSEYKAK
ncbi:extracellular solute-binding protein [Bacillus sp. FJAT-50079]|uniref:extracellular solute-binding protein n=1 Tax=Bacillus sp. FJAT-50079 TaxID=2833577 RepID=UPI001BC97A4E|nr:extracellular solute-binding protein [Bacillus sp. FJAT-50079]MBS4208675.1 extracellular solute-binding protein [Bacillus sp. FJAT-50079]